MGDFLLIPEQVLGDISMRACGANTELYLVRKEFSTPEVLLEKFRLGRIPNGEIFLGGGENKWSHKDGEENPDYPEYLWIVAKKI